MIVNVIEHCEALIIVAKYYVLVSLPISNSKMEDDQKQNLQLPVPEYLESPNYYTASPSEPTTEPTVNVPALDILRQNSSFPTNEMVLQLDESHDSTSSAHSTPRTTYDSEQLDTAYEGNEQITDP